MNKARKLLLAGGGLLITAFAHADPVDYGATLSTNMDTIDTLWGKVATIMVAVALVSVGVRFFRKAK